MINPNILQPPQPKGQEIPFDLLLGHQALMYELSMDLPVLLRAPIPDISEEEWSERLRGSSKD